MACRLDRNRIPFALLSGAALFGASLFACGEEPSSGLPPVGGSTAGSTATQPPAITGAAPGAPTATTPVATGPTTTTPTAPVPGSAGTTPGAPGTTPAANPPGGTAAPGVGGPALPTQVCNVLQNNGCIGCHQKQLQGGATMPLQWRADFAAMAKDGTPVGRRVMARVQDARSPMPPVTTMRPMMKGEEIAVLQQWVDGGMIGVEGTACEDKGAPVPGQVSWAAGEWPGEECEYVMTVGAHGKNGTPVMQDATPYSPPAGSTFYQCFYEQPPWGDKKVQALATRVRLDGKDDAAITHHLVMSALDPNDGMSILGGIKPSRGGETGECPNPSGSTVAVWAPGLHKQTTFPADTGLLMPSGAGAFIELQIHYNNTTSGQESRVAVDICATSKMRQTTAGVHWLGYENAIEAIPLAALGPEAQPQLDNKGGGVAVGQCRAKQRARLLWIMPHMHDLGKHSKIEILRMNGGMETIHDAPFDFADQTAHFYEDLWVEPGDTIRTTCTWNTSKKIVFGFASDEEMCFFYALAYPMGALAGMGAEKGVVGGELTCAGQSGN